MARRRYISTNTSVDKSVNRLGAEFGDFAELLYLLMIPHCEDDATMTGDPDELLATVLPMRRDKTPEDVAAALEAMDALKLIEWDRETSTVYFPQSFYKYQTYIPPAKRRGCSAETAENIEEVKQSAQFSEHQRKTPKNAASPSPSPSLDLTDRACAEGPSSVVSVEKELGIPLPRGNAQAKWLLDYCEQHPTEAAELRRILDSASGVRNKLGYVHGIAIERQRRRDANLPLEFESDPPPNTPPPPAQSGYRHPLDDLTQEERDKYGKDLAERKYRERIAQYEKPTQGGTA